MQDNGFGKRWVGSDISWCNPCVVVNELMSIPSGDVLLSDHHDLDLALELPNIIVKDCLSPLAKLSRFSKFDKKSSNSLVNWLGDQ